MGMTGYIEPPIVRGQYQPRNGMVKVVVGKMRRHCYCCNSIIPKGKKHIQVDNHLSSGWRNDINICSDCIQVLAKETV